jgi:superfamily I DNA and/or RNA helicase
MAEVDTIATLVRRYYRHTKFCVITPYDPQRGEIEKVLKDQNLPWEGKVFNVDSFQGGSILYLSSSFRSNQSQGTKRTMCLCR